MKRPKVWAHRFGRKWTPQTPENSLSALRKCNRIGVYGVEFDVHQCRSGELIVLHGGVHGGDLSHTTDGCGLVKDYTWDQLSHVRVNKGCGVQFYDERIPLLSDVFKIADPKMMLNIELKNAPWKYPNFADNLIREIVEHGVGNRVVISSFEHGILREIHRKAPRLKLGILIDALLVDIDCYAEKVGFETLHPYLGELREDYVHEAHAAGLEINVWTCNTPDEWQLAIQLGVDGIVTDDPVGLTEHLDSFFSRSSDLTTTALS